MHIQRQIFCRRHHVVDAAHTADVGDFVRVGDDGGCAVGEHRARERGRADKTALQMNMRVDKAGCDDFAADIDLHQAVVMVSHADDQPVGNGNIAMLNRAGKYVDIIGVFEDNIRLLLAQRDADEPLLPANLERNAFCAGFDFGHRGTRSFRDSVCPIIAV